MLMFATIMLHVAVLYSGFAPAQNPTVPTAGQPGSLAADFDLQNVAGGRTRLSEIQGRVIVLDFWATWAVPSQAEIPNLNRLHETLKGRGLQVTAIAADSGTAESIKERVSELGVMYPVLTADDKVMDAFGVVGFPTTFLLTRDARGWMIFGKYSGSSPARTERILRDIETLLAEK